MYRKGETTGSNQENRRMTQDHMEIQASLSSIEEEPLYDPQTSGGLLLSVPNSQATELLTALAAAGVSAAVRMGEIVEGSPGIVVV
jgi:selenide,water dikinase